MGVRAVAVGMHDLLPDEWTALTAYQRDVLAAIVRLDGASGQRLHDAVGNIDGRRDYETTTKQIKVLRERGLVEGDPPEGRNSKWVATSDGRTLITAARKWLGGVVPA